MLIAPETIPSAETIFAKVIRNKEFSFNDLQNYHTPIEWSSIFKYILWQLPFSYTVYIGTCQDNNGHVSIIRSHYINSYKECLEKGLKTKTCSAVTYNSGYCTLHRLVPTSSNGYILGDGSSNGLCYPLMRGIQIFIWIYFTTFQFIREFML